MKFSKRAFGLACASLALISVITLPVSSPFASDVIANTIDVDDLQTSAPSEAVLRANDYAILLDAEMVDEDAPVAISSDSFASGLDLPDLVRAVVDMHTVELSEDMRCLAGAIYNEARGESLKGQLAVAQVVLNRAASARWPSGLCEVVYQRNQFSYTFDGRPDYPTTSNRNWQRAEAVAIIAATGNWEDITDNALFFHATYVSPTWQKRFERTRKIGQHIFYR